jgi:hypothetical protein
MGESFRAAVTPFVPFDCLFRVGVQTALLEAVFPFAAGRVVWSQSPGPHCYPGTLSLAVASVFIAEQPWNAPHHMPVSGVSASGEL